MARLLSVLNVGMAVCIATAAAFETAIEVQERLPDTKETIVPIPSWSNFVPLALLTLATCIWFARVFLSGQKTIQILAPLENSTVPAVREVRGSVWPASEPVQIFVLTGREWRPQQLPARDGAYWSAQCHFETAAAGSTSEYKIAAISRATLVVGPVKRLPWWSTTSSTIVRVTRREQ
jgi:hypothetical protein